MTMVYNDKHRQFLQYIMHKKIVTENDAKNVNKLLFPEKKIDDTIELINTKIAPHEFKINKVKCEQNNDIFYVFIAAFTDDFNDKPDPNKLIFKEVVNYILAGNGSVPYDELVIFNKQISSTLIDDFITNKYLFADKDKNIFLSPLAISELEAYLANLDYRCMACKSLVAYGIKCHLCNEIAHGHCLVGYFEDIGKKVCPKCSAKLSADWKPIIIVNKL